MRHNNSVGAAVTPGVLAVGVDLDGVVFDFHSAALRKVHAVCGFDGSPLAIHELQSHDIRDNYEKDKQKLVESAVLQHCLNHEHFEKLDFLEDGLQLVDSLLRANHLKVQFLTARNPDFHRLSFLMLSKRLYRMGHYIEPDDLHAFGSTAAKAAYIVQVGFDFIIEDNPLLYHLLGDSLPDSARLLLAQPWNRSEKKLRRYSHSEIQETLCRYSIRSRKQQTRTQIPVGPET